MISREEMVYQSRLAEQAERYEDMVDKMKKVAEMEPEMSVEERNLLSVAYKNVIGTKRASWRIITSLEQKEQDKKTTDDKQMEHIRDYKRKIECELKDICTDVLKVLEKIIDKQENPESKVFYCKMKGDYYRYLAEITTEKTREENAIKSEEAYKTAMEESVGTLKPTNPIRLGLALNFSVFYYEIRDKCEEACKKAKEAFDAALKELDAEDEDTYKDSTLIMQLLRDNLTLWTSDHENPREEDDDQRDQSVEVQDLEQEES